jgi:hypothetical protein
MRMSVRMWMEIRVENPVVPVFRCQLAGHTTQSMGISGQIMKGLFIVHRLCVCNVQYGQLRN